MLHHRLVSGRWIDFVDVLHHEPLIIALLAFALGVLLASRDDENSLEG